MHSLTTISARRIAVLFGIIFSLSILALFPTRTFAAVGQTWISGDTTAAGDTGENNWNSVVWAASAPNGSGGTGLFVAGASSGTSNRIMTSPDGINWTARGSAADLVWSSIAWSPTLALFVATSATAGAGNKVMTSPDGITWTSRASAIDANSWNSVTWSPSLGIFVAVANAGTGNKVMTSPDGINWTSRASAVDTSNWFSVVWSPELAIFVATGAVGTGNRVMTSPDGINWTSRASAADNNWFSVTWSPELMLFAAISNNGVGNRVMTSPDGINWTSRTSAVDNNWRGVTWASGINLFVAVGATGTNRVMTSPDGITWTSRTSAIETNIWFSVAWSPKLAMLVAVSQATGANRVMSSTDGINWTSRSSALAVDNTWWGVAWSPTLNLFVAVASASGATGFCTQNGRCIMTSPDGINWTVRTVPSTNYYWTSVVWSPSLGLFVAVAQASITAGQFNYVMTSPDGINWTSRTTPNENTWFSITWSPSLSLFVAVASTGNGTGQRVMTSPDAITWTSRTAAAANTWYSVTWAPSLGLFAAVSASGTGNRVMTSPDGITWTSRTSAADNTWNSITWSDDLSLFVAVASTGTGNRIMTSPDGITWTSRTTTTDGAWGIVTWSHEASTFVVLSATNLVATSTDGINWTLLTATGSGMNAGGWSGMTWSPSLGVFAAVGQLGFHNRAMISGPALPTSVSAGTPGLTTATITWTTDVASNSQVNYGTTSSYGTSTTLDTALVTSHSVSISGLTCNTLYHYKVVSAEGSITSSSQDATFSTASCGPTVTTSTSSSITQTTATLNGTIVSGGASTVTVRGFRYGITSSYGTTTTQSGTFSTGAFTAAITSLTCNTTYHFQVYATNSLGTGTSTPDAVFTTSACVPGAPTSPYVIATSGQAKFYWTTPASNGGAAVSDYLIEYKLSSASSWTAFSHTASTTTNSIITGLTNGSIYNFRVSAVNSTGTGSVSSTVSGIPSALPYFHILSTGQSLAVGGNAGNITLTQPYNNLSLSSRVIAGAAAPLIPLVETSNETPSSGMLNSLHALDTLGHNFIMGLHGVAGWDYNLIKKGGTAYTNGMAQASVTKAQIEAAGGVYQPLAVTIIHGESDAIESTSASTYLADMIQMQTDYETDLHTLAGGTATIPLFESQMNSNSTGTIAVSQLQAHINDPGKVILVGPKYQYPYYSDNIHLTDISYKNLGEMFAKVMDKVMLQGQTWNPLMPTAIQQVSNVVTLSYAIPTGTLALDTTTVAQRANYGFEFTQTGGTATSISSVALVNNNTQVQITLSQAPDGTSPHIRYAWNCYATPNTPSYSTCGNPSTSTFVGGNIRDTDSSVSPSSDSTGLPLYDWSVAFDQAITSATAPSAPTALAGTAGDTQVALAWTAPNNGGSAIIDYTVEYKLSSDSSWTTFAHSASTTAARTVTGLTNASSYDFRVSVINSIGTSSVSSTATATPASAIFAPTVTTGTSSSVAATSVTLAGTITATGGATVTSRGFNYGTTTSYGRTVSESGSFSTGAFTASVTSLTCNTTYHFQAYATNSAGTAVGADNNFTTTACVPTVTASAASSIVLTSATLNGTVTATGGATVTTRGVYYGVSTSYGSTVSASGSFSTGAFNSSVTSLTCNTMYHYQAFATNVAGTSVGADDTFTTSACVPTVTTSAVSLVDTTNATLNGTVTATGGATVTTRGFNWGTTSAYGTTTTESGSFSTGAFTTDLTGLTCGTTYHFQSYATNSVGTGTSTPDAIFSTSACAVVASSMGASSTPVYRSGGTAFLGTYNTSSIVASDTNTPVTVTTTISTSSHLTHAIFVRTLNLGALSADVKRLQQFLNSHGFIIATSGAGAPGHETTTYGTKTALAVKRFQEANAKYVLTPNGLKKGTGYFGPATLKFVNQME
jgi:hypothetical protein